MIGRSAKGLVAGGTPRVNLLPPHELEQRGRRRLRMRWLGAFVATFVLLNLVAGIVGIRTLNAQAAQLTATHDLDRLQSELTQYTRIINLGAKVRELEDLRAQAGSNDQNWGSLITQIKVIIPHEVTLVGFNLTSGAVPTAGADPSTQVGLRGTLTFSAKAPSAQDETIRQLRTVGAFLYVDAGELSSDGPQGGYTFVANFSADQTRYSGRFDKSEGK